MTTASRDPVPRTFRFYSTVRIRLIRSRSTGMGIPSGWGSKSAHPPRAQSAHHVAQLSMQVAGQPSADLRARGDAAGVGWRRARGASACAVVHVIVRGGYALAPQASLGKARRKKGRPPMMSEGARSVERLRLPRVSHLTTLPHEPIFPIGQKEAV